MNPLWMPKASVHALLAFFVVGVSGYMVTQQLEVPQWWQLLTGGVLGGYSWYRQRSPTDPPPQKPPVNLDEVDLLRGTDG